MKALSDRLGHSTISLPSTSIRRLVRSLIDWRRRWDSNPRNICMLDGFQDRSLRPLGHVSGGLKCKGLGDLVEHPCTGRVFRRDAESNVDARNRPTPPSMIDCAGKLGPWVTAVVHLPCAPVNSDLRRTLVPVVLMTAGVTVLAGFVAGALGAALGVAAGDAGDMTALGLVLIAIATTTGTLAGSLLGWRRGAAAVTAVVTGTGAALSTQVVLTILARLGGASVGGGTILASGIGAVVGAVAALLVLAQRQE